MDLRAVVSLFYGFYAAISLLLFWVGLLAGFLSSLASLGSVWMYR
jgi:hypothetical protein